MKIGIGGKNAFAILLFFSAIILFAQNEAKDLIVTFSEPSGFLYNDVSEITVIFSEDIVELNKGEDSNPPIKIYPAINGKYLWKSPRILTFTPDDKLDLNRKYTVKVKKGLQSLSKKHELKKDFTFVFVNNANRVVSVYAFSNGKSNGTERMDLSDTLAVTFAHTPLSADVGEKITVKDAVSGKYIPVSIKFKKDDFKTVYVIINEKLKNKKDYFLNIDYTLRSDYGDMGLASNYTLKLTTRPILNILDHTKGIINPASYPVIEFSDMIEPYELAKEIIIFSGRDTVKNDDIYIWQNYDYENEESNNYRISFYKKGGTEYTVIVPKEYTLNKKEYKFTFTTSDNNPELYLNGETFLLESYKSGIIPIKSINTDSILVEISLIGIDSTKKVFKGMVPVTTKKNTYQTIPLKFKQLVKGVSGYYDLNIMDPKTKTKYERFKVNYTRYAIMAKIAYNQMIVLVYDLETGEPVQGGEVIVPKKKLKGITDKNGYCFFYEAFSKKERDGYDNLWIYFKKGDMTSVLNVNDNLKGPDYNRNIYTSYGYRKIYNDDWSLEYYKESRTGLYIYTDRGLYKPGEILNIKGIARVISGNEWTIPKNKEVSINIYDSREAKIESVFVKMNDFGTFAVSCTLSQKSPTGSYRIECKTENKSETEHFRVEEFKPLEFDVAIASNIKNVNWGDSPIVNISGRYLYGASMASDSLRWKITSRYFRFSPKGYEGYSFYNGYSYYDEGYDYYYDNGSILYQGNSVLDSTGLYNIIQEIKPSNVSNDIMITYSATVKSASGQEITRSTNMVYHPTKTYIGLRMKNYVYNAKSKPVINIVAVDFNGKQIKGKDCRILVINEKYISVKKTGTYGRTYWENSYVHDTIIDDDVAIKNGMTDYSINKNLNTGYYRVNATYSEDERIYNVEESFYFAGENDGWWQVRNDSYIEIIPDKKNGEYKIGDKAKVLVKTPYKGLKGFITIEREGIYKKFAINLKSNAEVVEFTITEDMMPNAILSCFVYKGRSSNEIKDDSIDVGKPYFGVGFANLKVSSEKKHLSVSIKTDKNEYKPQENVSADIQVLNWSKKGVKAEISVAVVDLGILNLIGFETPDPFKEFYKIRSHDVSLSTNAGDIVGERNYGEKGENRGGDGGMTKFRTEFLPLVYYKADIVTDENGKAKIEFKLPDNLTTFRIMVVGCNVTDFGSGYKDFTVNKNFILTQSLPNFVRDGDTFIGGVVAVNMTKNSGEYNITCKAEGAHIDTVYNPAGNLVSGGKNEVLCKYTVDTSNDTIVLKFKGNFGAESDALLVKIPVRKNPLVYFSGIYESTEDKQKVHKLNLAGIEKGVLDISISSTGLNDVKKATEYLFEYPYGCLEQRTSKAFPLIIGEDIINAFDIGNIKGEHIKNAVQRQYLDLLENYQQSNGGFSVWPKAGDPVNPYLTNYVFYIMHYAKQNGYNVNSTVYEKAKNYVSNIAGNTLSNPYYEYYSESSITTTRLFSIYLLKLCGRNVDSYIAKYSNELEKMNGEELAWFLLSTEGNAKHDAVKKRVLQRIDVLTRYEGMYAYFDCDKDNYDEIYGSSEKLTSLLFYALLCDKGKDLKESEKFMSWILKKRTLKGHWSNTQENAFVILTLDKYFKTFESKEPNFKASVSIDKKAIFETAFKGYSLAIKNESFSIEGGKTEDIEINKEGNGRIYYSLLFSHDSPSESEPVENGFSISKTIEPYNHSEKEFIRGKMYKVTLHIKTANERMYVVVDDPIPAGFEIINSALKTNEQINSNDDNHYNRWFGSFNHTEKYFDRMLLFADYLNDGEYTETYYIRAIYPGKFYMPSAKIEEMYSPNVYGSASSGWIEIK